MNPTWPHVEVPGLDWVVAPYEYTGVMRGLIQDFKFNLVARSGHRIRDLLSTHFRGVVDVDLVVPIPGDQGRESERGFRSSEWLWHGVIGAPMASIVQRVRDTPALYAQSRIDRVNTLSDAFDIAPELVPKGVRIMLIDDIVTTGATASAVATQLRKAGAGEVGLLVVAATPMV